MKDRIAFYLLTSLALSGVFTLTACPRDSVRVSTDQGKTWGNIEIGRYGNVLSFPGVRPIREGYAFAYQDPKSPGKEKVVYYADNRLSYGLKPVSLTSNAPAEKVAPGQEITVTAVVATDDGLFQSTHEFRWTAGNDDLEVTRTIKKMGSGAVRPRWFNVLLTLNAKEFSRDENMMTILPEPCPPIPDRPIEDCPIRIYLKVLGPVAWAIDKTSRSAKLLLGELSSGDSLPLPKQAEKYDVVLGLRGDSPILKDQSLTLKYVYHMDPKVRK
jgi:hypothetical protein